MGMLDCTFDVIYAKCQSLLEIYMLCIFVCN